MTRHRLFVIFLLTGYMFQCPNVEAQPATEQELLKQNRLVEKMLDKDVDRAYALGMANLERVTNYEYSKEAAAQVYMTVAMIHDGRSEFRKAIQFILKAIDILEQKKNYPLLIQAYNSLGGIYYNSRNYERTIHYTKKALDLAESKGIDDKIPILYNNLAGANLKLRFISEAERSARKGLRSLTLSDDQMRSVVLNTLGEIYYEKDNFDSAIYYSKRALTAAVSYPDFILGRLPILRNLGRSLWANGAQEEAKMVLRQCFQVAGQNGFTFFQKEAAKYLADIWEKQGKKDSMYFYRGSYLELLDKLWNLEKEKDMHQAVVQFREEQIREERAQASEQRFLVVIAVVTAVFLLMLLGILLWWNAKSRRLGLEIKKQNNQLNAQKQELEQFHTIKDRIFSTLLHDFKTPLNSLEAIVGMLENKHLTPDEASALGKNLKVDLAKNRQSIESLIAWSKDQMHKLEPNYQKINLEEFTSRILAYHRIMLEHKGIELKTEHIGKQTSVVDEEILFIVVNNLISNAIKFTPQDGTIKIVANSGERHLDIRISDSGMGIPSDELDSIFSRTKASKTGSGIGLSICKELLSKLGGSIEAHSTGAEGTIFDIKIPIYDLVSLSEAQNN